MDLFLVSLGIALDYQIKERKAAVKLSLEMEIGITGVEEDGVDNSVVRAESSTRSLNRWDKLLQYHISTLLISRFIMCTRPSHPLLQCSPLLQHLAICTECTRLAMCPCPHTY